MKKKLHVVGLVVCYPASRFYVPDGYEIASDNDGKSFDFEMAVANVHRALARRRQAAAATATAEVALPRANLHACSTGPTAHNCTLSFPPDATLNRNKPSGAMHSSRAMPSHPDSPTNRCRRCR